MISPQLILDLNHELIIDNFAGGGGASTGIELALGRHADHAINHNAEALGMHRINHPQTVHHCEDVFDVNPLTLTEGRPVGLAWFSPDCKHFSKAKGGKPVDKKIRGLVLVMLRWAKIRPRVMFMENVEEIQTWGPLIPRGDGWHPDPAHKGRTWKAFLDCLSTGIDPLHPDLPEILEVLDGTVTKAELVRGFGYHYEARELRACDYGTPTIRKRLFMIARCDGLPIVWPTPTHAPTTQAAALGLRPYRAIAECIDWAQPCHSIFLSTAEGKAVRVKRPLVPATLRRIATGMGRFVLHSANPFLVSLTHQGGERVESITDPINTITGAHRGEKALAVPTVVNTANSKTTGRGPNAWDAEEPLRTVTSAPGFAMAEATLAPIITEHAQSENQRNMPADEPMRTQCASVKGGHFALVSGTLVHCAHGEQDKNGNPRRGKGSHGLEECTPTVTCSKDLALAGITMVQTGYGEREGQTPRAMDPSKPGGTAVAGACKQAVATAHMVKLRGDNIGDEVTKPMHTASAGGTHHGIVAAVLAQANGGYNTVPARAANEPLSAITGTGSQQQLVAATGVAFYGTEEDGEDITQPARTATTKARFGHVESTLANGLTPEQEAGARRVAAFLREYGIPFAGEFATITTAAGVFVIVDIGMRMLTPRELFRAQGFPESYVIDKAWHIDAHTGEINEVPLTKEQQIRMCGNSVCPPVAAAIVKANVPELGISRTERRAPRRHRAQTSRLISA